MRVTSRPAVAQEARTMKRYVVHTHNRTVQSNLTWLSLDNFIVAHGVHPAEIIAIEEYANG